MKYALSIIALLFPTLFLSAADVFVSFTENERTALKLTGTTDTIVYDKNDWNGVKIAIGNLKKDLRAVTGSDRAPIIVGTVGRRRIASEYKSICRQLKGKWEQYIITVRNGKLIILGSDKRGTIYGIYELSKQIGVSPWYWMADAPIRHHEELYINKGIYRRRA